MGGGKGSRYESGMSHLRNSMTGVCVGPVLAIAGIYLIFWNEGRAIHTLRDIEEVRDDCIELPCGATYDVATRLAKAGDTVYFGGCNVSQLPNITDGMFNGADAAGPASAMHRTTQGFFYTQKCSSDSTSHGGSVTTCNYPQAWVDCAVSEPSTTWDTKDSDYSRYKNYNRGFSKCHALASSSSNPAYCGPKEMGTNVDCATRSIQVGNSTAVSSDIIDKLFAATPVANLVSTFGLNSSVQHITAKDAYRTVFSISRNGSEYCSGGSCSRTVGNMKVTFVAKKFDQVSVIGKLVTYGANTRNVALERVVGSNGGTPMTYAALGDVSVDTMIEEAKDENAAMTWTIRFVGLLIIWIGGCCCVMPLAKLSSLFGTCLGELAETAICCITAPVAFFITLTTIAIGWIAYRPTVAYPLLGTAAVFVIASYFVVNRHRKRRGEAYAPLSVQSDPVQPAPVFLQQSPPQPGYPPQQQGYPPQQQIYPPQQGYPPPQQGYPPQQQQGYAPQQQQQQQQQYGAQQQQQTPYVPPQSNGGW